MSEIWMKRGLRGLEPADDAGLEVLRRIKQGDIVRADITRPRNIRHHRKFFALLNLVWSASGEWASVEDLLIELKVRLGLTRDVIIRSTGEIVKVPASISFAAMNQLAFDNFYERALRELCAMAGGIDSNILREEVLSQLAAA